MSHCTRLLAYLLLLAGGLAAQVPSVKDMEAMIVTLRPLHRRLGPPAPGDWLATHRESGQSFRQYRASEPPLPRPPRSKVYVQPIGDFTEAQQRILDKTVEGMAIYLGLPVVCQKPLPATEIPPEALRRAPSTGRVQFLAPHILDEILLPTLPADAAARIGLTATDLWAGAGWNFVFGQASLEERVGVWSLARLGDPGGGPEVFRTCLRRALATAVHETCHMFGFLHCTAFECLMCGSNSLDEGDRLPFWLCPPCLAKLCWAAQVDPLHHLRTLQEYCAKEGLYSEAKFLARSSERLEKAKHFAIRTSGKKYTQLSQ